MSRWSGVMAWFAIVTLTVINPIRLAELDAAVCQYQTEITLDTMSIRECQPFKGPLFVTTP
jgi:hypothetical protein